jgi:hypothetical protein
MDMDDCIGFFGIGHALSNGQISGKYVICGLNHSVGVRKGPWHLLALYLIVEARVRVGEVNFKTLMKEITYRIHMCMEYSR